MKYYAEFNKKAHPDTYFSRSIHCAVNTHGPLRKVSIGVSVTLNSNFVKIFRIPSGEGRLLTTHIRSPSPR